MEAQPKSKLDFLIIGGAKCATTWLQESLSANAGIFMPAPELHFFSREFDRGRNWYDAQFASARPGDLVGEKSNSYLTEPAAADRIAADIPNARLIVQMRNPVERAYSDYCMLYRRGTVSGDIRQYLDPDMASDGRFLPDGLYAHHIERFLSCFASEQILLLAYEDISTAPESQLQKVATHIGFRGAPALPVHDKVKDRAAPVVPRPIRKVLSPFRPVLDPLRRLRPIRALRDVVARPVVYPPLPPDLAAKMAAYYLRDIERLRTFAPKVVERWQPMS